MAPFMPSACSDRRRRRLAIVLTALLASAALPAMGAAGWGLAAFPVLAFERYSSPFGLRRHPMHGDARLHDGLDIAAPAGSPVRSWWRGRVVAVIADRGCGVGLVIRSGDYEHLYCHLSGSVSGGRYRAAGIQLAVGDRVATGQLIARVGSSGMATGPHLHWGLRWRGQLLDPVAVLRAMASDRSWPSATGWSPSNLKSLR